MAGQLSQLHKNKSVIFGHLGALLCVSMWGASFVATKVLLNNQMQPVEIYVYRFIIAYILILLIKPTRLFCNNWRDEGLFVICGMLSGSAYFLMENFALRYTLVSNVSLLTSTSPLITTLLVAILYRADRPGAGVWIGSSVAFVGVACVIFNSSFSLEVRPLGDILALAASFSWSLYSLILKKLNANYNVWFITRKTFFYGVATALPLFLIEPPHFAITEVLKNWELMSNLIFLSLGASIVAFVLWSETIKKVGAMKANDYMYFQPIVTLIISAVLLHEHVSFIGYLGCALILGGLWLGDYITRRKQFRS